jgi:hypothetical protein
LEGIAALGEWEQNSEPLKALPHLRGPSAYFAGLRYSRMGKPDAARAYFRAALEDAARGPPQPLLDHLARVELDRMAGK